MKRVILTAAILGIAWAGSVRARQGEPRGEDAEKARATQALELAAKEASRYEIGVEAGAKAIELDRKALLQWSNPVAGSIHGAVFVWLDRGRPAVVGSIYKWFSPNHHMGVELHSLTSGPISADRAGRALWSANRPGVERKAIPGAPSPAATAAGRLRQIRALAREFEATQTTREGLTRELRLLPRPLYRYESTDPDVIDGGLFAFGPGTDPEIILLVEARKSPEGTRWEFAAARMNSIALKLSRKGAEAWSAPVIPWSQARDHREPYSLFIFDPDPGMGAGDGPST